jgi:hypothetical protein
MNSKIKADEMHHPLEKYKSELLLLCVHGYYLLISHKPFLSLPFRLMILRSRNFLICFSMPRLLSPVFSAISVADNAGSESSNNSTRFSFTPNFTPNFAPNFAPNYTYSVHKKSG